MIKGINHITFAVSDIDRSFKFYRDIIGLKPVFRSSKSAYFTSDDDWIALVEDKKTRKECLEEYSHISFTVDNDQIKNLRKKLEEADVKIWKENSSEGDSIYFLDPDGHKIEFHSNSLQDRLKHFRDNMKDEYIFY